MAGESSYKPIFSRINVEEMQQQWSVLRELLEVAQMRMKNHVDNKRSEREFDVGEKVYLKLQPYRSFQRCKVLGTRRHVERRQNVEKMGPELRLRGPEQIRIPTF